MSDAYYRMYPREWDEGCDELTHEEEIAYLKIVNMICSRNRPIEDEEDMNRALARRARLGWAKWKKVKAALIEKGKIRIEDGLIMQRRALEEVAYRRRILATKSDNPSGPRTPESPENSEISQKNSENSEKFPENFAEISGVAANENSHLAETGAVQSKPEPEPLAKLSAASARAAMTRLLEVAGPGLADPAKTPSIHTSASEILRWLKAGCDLEEDIVPVIQSRTATARGSPIKSWTYFTTAVLEETGRNRQELTIPEPDHEEPARTAGHRSATSNRSGGGRSRGSSIADICAGAYAELPDEDDPSGR